jgi:type I restriction enzyme S subunit
MLRITNLDISGGVELSEVVWVPKALSDEYRRTLVGSGDLVVSVVGSMGKASVISRDVEGSNLNRALARVQLRYDLDPWIMWHWVQTTDFLDQARLATGGGTAQPTLNLGDLAEFKVGLPTNPEEWPKISAILFEAHQAYLSLNSRLQSQIKLLRERRQTLIMAAVTGELEIPGVAA